MNANDTIRSVHDDVIELGVASVETRGAVNLGEPIGGPTSPGISEE